MAYLGRQPVIGNFVKLDAISVVNGQAAYTMQNNSVNFTDYATVNQFLVSLNGTVQSPGSSFSVSSSTITFSSNLSTGDVIDFIIVFGNSLSAGTPTDGTVTTAKVVDGAITSAKLASGVAGAALTGSTDNTVVTVTGANAIAGEATLTYDGTTLSNIPSGTQSNLRLQNSTTGSGGTDGLLIQATGNDVYINNYENADMYFRTNNTNRMIIDSSGSVGIGKTPDGNVGTVGFEVFEGNALLSCRNGNTVAYFNRNTNDGTIISLRQANTEEGTISVSGSTVSYNGFTGTHWSRFTDNSTPTILRGTVLETLDEMCDWYNLEFDNKKVPHVLLDSQSNGDTVTYNHNGTDYEATIVKETDVKHMMSKVSDTTDAKNVYGLFVAYDLDGDGYNDFYVASAGSYVVRIKSGETIAKGDLLQSNGDGTAKVQIDDNIKSSSFAKVLSTTKIETYEDGSFIVPCSLMC